MTNLLLSLNPMAQPTQRAGPGGQDEVEGKEEAGLYVQQEEAR